MKRTIAFGITLMIFLGITISSATFDDIKDLTSSEDGVSIQINIDKPCFWYVLHVKFSSPTNVTIREKHIQKQGNNSHYEPEIFDGVYTYDPVSHHCGGHRGSSSYGYTNKRYIQVDIGNINFSYKDYNEVPSHYNHTSNGLSSYTNMSGTMFFIFFGFAVEGDYKYWFNTSKQVEIVATAQGEDTFSYHRDDFHGKINLGTEKAIFQMDGVIDIDVDNILFCWYHQLDEFELDDFKGIGSLSVSRNDMVFAQKFTQTIFSSISQELATIGWPYNDFLYGLPPGDYRFTSSCFFWGGYYPDIKLYGMDIILPFE